MSRLCKRIASLFSSTLESPVESVCVWNWVWCSSPHSFALGVTMKSISILQHNYSIYVNYLDYYVPLYQLQCWKWSDFIREIGLANGRRRHLLITAVNKHRAHTHTHTMGLISIRCASTTKTTSNERDFEYIVMAIIPNDLQFILSSTRAHGKSYTLWI